VTPRRTRATRHILPVSSAFTRAALPRLNYFG
jgi:hypothetical protein